MNMIDIRGLYFRYDREHVLKDISLEVEKGSFIGVLGPNGSGKTTLLKCISGVLSPERGEILLEGRTLDNFSRREIARRVAVVPQGSEVVFDFKAFEMVLMGRTPYIKPLRGETSRDYSEVKRAMQATGTWDLAERGIKELSGGERQRVAIARALAQEPRLLLLDEPTAFLDINHQIEIFDLVKRLNQQRNLTVVVVLHDLNLAAQYCQHLILLDRGQVFAAGGLAEVLTPEKIRAVYRTEVEVVNHPGSGNMHIIPLSWAQPRTDYRKRRGNR